MATPTVPFGYKGLVEVGKIEIGRHCIVGANSVVMPNVRFGNGAALAALSLAKRDLEPWMLYGGIPAKKLKARDQAAIEKLEQEFLSSKQHVK